MQANKCTLWIKNGHWQQVFAVVATEQGPWLTFFGWPQQDKNSRISFIDSFKNSFGTGHSLPKMNSISIFLFWNKKLRTRALCVLHTTYCCHCWYFVAVILCHTYCTLEVFFPSLLWVDDRFPCNSWSLGEHQELWKKSWNPENGHHLKKTLDHEKKTNGVIRLMWHWTQLWNLFPLGSLVHL